MYVTEKCTDQARILTHTGSHSGGRAVRERVSRRRSSRVIGQKRLGGASCQEAPIGRSIVAFRSLISFSQSDFVVYIYNFVISKLLSFAIFGGFLAIASLIWYRVFSSLDPLVGSKSKCFIELSDLLLATPLL